MGAFIYLGSGCGDIVFCTGVIEIGSFHKFVDLDLSVYVSDWEMSPVRKVVYKSYVITLCVSVKPGSMAYVIVLICP